MLSGNVIQTEPKDMYLARVAALNGGVAQHASALTVTRLCGSALSRPRSPFCLGTPMSPSARVRKV
ncbi:MAG: 3-ketoacyl-CoA thiolase (EC @ Acetyl-CoA acetyltransferase (EC [uncultured Caballeronia sp.]|nr:MAG: 3-ketoacyl-CoA thiolase (EC @ Acetyl-CoA acetyltransferase (EC [uncultured Caballeronia sp.]